MVKKRLIVYTKDIQQITGKSDRYGRYLLERIRTHYGKEPHHYVTIYEFSSYTGIEVEVLREYIE